MIGLSQTQNAKIKSSCDEDQSEKPTAIRPEFT
jgi:hypothetical protein